MGKPWLCKECNTNFFLVSTTHCEQSSIKVLWQVAKITNLFIYMCCFTSL